MRVRVQPCDTGGCGYYRARWPGAALAAQGCDVVVADTEPMGQWRDDNGVPRLLNILDVDYDVIVLQRPLAKRWAAHAIRQLQAQGVTVIVEIDDDFHALPKGHPARAGTSAMKSEDYNRGWLRRACEQADLVTCTTPAIAERYAPHGRVAIIPNFVPAAFLTFERTDSHDRPIIGWTGSLQTHVNDLPVVGTAVRDVLADTDARLHIVGTGVGVARQLQLEQIDSASGWVEFEDYPRWYASLDVAIVPLEACRFNDAKSWLKGLEAAALGVPVVCSPTEPYRRLAAAGMCELAEHPDEWRMKLARLVRSEQLRVERFALQRDAARGFTIEGNAWRWWEAWAAARSMSHPVERIAV